MCALGGAPRCAWALKAILVLCVVIRMIASHRPVERRAAGGRDTRGKECGGGCDEVAFGVGGGMVVGHGAGG